MAFSTRLTFFLTICLAVSLAGCSTPKVQAWDKQDLAKPEMALDTDRLETRYSEHIYFSREGYSGGWSIGGGGCGCN
jgi:hypothetical protein